MKPFETPTSRRFPEYWQPRANIKKEGLVMEICRQRQTLTALPPNSCVSQCFYSGLGLEGSIKHLSELVAFP